MKEHQPATVLVIRAGALGDTVLALPAVQTLCGHFPSARVYLAGHPTFWAVGGLPHVELLSVDAPRLTGLLAGTPGAALASWLRDIDLTIAWTGENRSAALRAAGVLRVVSAVPLPPPGVHAAAWLSQTLAPVIAPIGEHHSTFTETNPKPTVLRFTEDEREWADEDLHRLGMERPVVLHPGAGAPWKRWSPARFAQVGEYLQHRGQPVLVIEGPADRDTILAVQAATRHPFAVLREHSPRRLAALLARCALYIGNDSGVTHLAAAAGPPVVALFGPTDPASWAPLGDVRVVRTCTARATRQGQIRVCMDDDCMDGISMAQVVAAIG